ncbi:MAG: VWA domain-containing protein [Acidobacteriaceae bacterium]|nr:VWA domain-containing protein [Acidobacteriaceae bacterium]
MLSQTIVDFCRFTRAHGFGGGVLDTLEALESVRVVGGGDGTSFKHALRTSLCSSKDEWDAFDDLFDRFWNGTPGKKHQHQESGRDARGSRILAGLTGQAVAQSQNDGKAVSGASAYDRLVKTDFSEISGNDQSVLEKIAQRLFKQLNVRLSRRRKIVESRIQIDLRRTIRQSTGRGGELVDLRYKGKKPRPLRLVILLDVSGSMNLYSVFLLRFAHALQNRFMRTNTFMFSTRLVDITGALCSPDVTDALKALSEIRAAWAGGTKIGESLRTFNLLYGRKLLARDTLFIILSDGWDTGEPELLASELHTIKKRVRRLIWLNPLLGLEDYQPVTRAMAAALPYVDVFAPAHSLESLMNLERHICSMSS